MLVIAKAASRFPLAITLGLVAAVLPARSQAQSKAPEIPEKVSPLEIITAPTSDKRTATAVVRKPPGKGPFPAMIYLHGGWKKQPVETLKRWATEMPTVTRFLAAGYVVIVATYHGIEEDPQTPKALADILAIVEHVKKMPEVDSNSVVVWGQSGGGSFALELAGATQLCAIAVGEPASGLLSGIFAKETLSGKPPFGGEHVRPIRDDPEKFITDAARKRTRDKVLKISCPVFYAHSDTVSTNKLQDLLLVPELKKMKPDLKIKRYPELPHTFSTRHEPFFTDCDAFFKKYLKTQPTPLNSPAAAQPDEVKKDELQVGLNHIYLVVDEETFKSLAASEFLKNEFCGFEQRTTTAGDGRSWTGIYLYGTKTYLEFLPPAKDRKVGQCGIALGVDQPGSILRVLDRLATIPDARSAVMLTTRERKGDKIPWFYRAGVRWQEPETVLFAWLMEYHPDYLRKWYPDTRPEDAGVSRAKNLARLYNADRLFKEVAGMTVALPDQECKRFLQVLKALGCQIEKSGEGHTARSPEMEFIVVPESPGAKGLVELQLLLSESIKGDRKHRFGPRSILEMRKDKTARWRF